MERDYVQSQPDVKIDNFNSHAHVERDGWKGQLVISSINFNSHAHVERDEFVCKKCHDNFISTHTLTWSVTFCHALPPPNVNDFNSHAHVERDT